jgi:preprotein translocase subunit SecG
MQNVLLTIHIIACIALVIAVMLQRSEGGALGMSGGGTGGLISGRGAASALVRTTMGLALVFFATSVVMTRLNNNAGSEPSLLEREAGKTTSDPFSTLDTMPAQTTPDALGSATPVTPPETAPTNAAPTPAPATTPDPLAPKAKPSTSAAAAAVPATTAPTTPATTPKNSGSPTP